MRIAVGVDWSDQAFTAVQSVAQLYEPNELILVHAVDLRPFESPLFAPAIAKEAYEEFRASMLDAGNQLLDRTSDLVPNMPSIRRILEFGSPAEVILHAVRAAQVDLLAVGARGKGRLSELVFGSVSHRILMHAPCSTLVVKRGVKAFRRVLVTVEGNHDVEHIKQWLRSYPFRVPPKELIVMTAVPSPHFADPVPIPALTPGIEAALPLARQMVEDIATELRDAGYSATSAAFRGDAAETITREANTADLVIVGSHARLGVERFLLGSVSHAITHSVSCPVLVIRTNAS